MSTKQDLKDIDKAKKGLAKLGQDLKSQFSDAAKILYKPFSLASGASLLVSQTKDAISELKELDAILTSISRQNPSLSSTALEKIGDDAFDAAGKYGQKAADYLAAFQQASQAGYDNAQAFASLSLALQAAGDISSQTASQYLFAMDAAFGLGSSVQELYRILDGSSAVASHNAIGLAELTQAMALAGSQAASLGLDAQETAAALASMMASSHLSGADAAQAFSQLLQSFDNGQKDDVLKAIADNYGGYDRMLRMLQQYANSVGSLATQAEVAATSWESSLNRLSNTWTETVGNFADSGLITATLDGLNGILSVLNKITQALGPIGSIGAGAGLFANIKDVGRDKRYSLSLF